MLNVLTFVKAPGRLVSGTLLPGVTYADPILQCDAFQYAVEVSLRAVEALGNDVSAEQVRTYLADELGLSVRPNHLGMALQRHRCGGRLAEYDGRWSMSAGSGENTREP